MRTETHTHLLLADARSSQAGLAVDDDVVVLEGDVARRRRPQRPRVVRIGGRLQRQVAEQHEARFARLQDTHTNISRAINEWMFEQSRVKWQWSDNRTSRTHLEWNRDGGSVAIFSNTHTLHLVQAFLNNFTGAHSAV